ncbi:MAG: hypothetical protein OEU90_05350, partial [Gammaproteobacteria bacterium]|nr:hypothetical protein [Gammaproteobacteria bacterium]
MKRSHLTLLAALLIGSAPLVTSAAGWSPNDPLMPTGNSTQDTANLQNAIHDARLDAGGTLYLGPGVFLVHASLVRQTPDPDGFGYNPVPFNGTIKGAGKSVTTIKSVRGPGGEPFTPAYDKVFNSTYPGTFFIWNEDYLGIRDMTFEADSEIADEWLYGGEVGLTKGLLSYVGTGSGEYGVGNRIGTDVINVHFKGSLDSSGRPEIPHLFEPYGGAGGTHNVKSSEFENGLGAMLIYAQLANATINVGGRPKEQVTFANAATGAIVVVGCSDCTVNVSRIETHDAPGLYFSRHKWNMHSLVTMTHNTIILRPQSDYAGAEIWSRFDDVDIVLSHNRFQSEDSFVWGPIFIEGVKHGTIT